MSAPLPPGPPAPELVCAAVVDEILEALVRLMGGDFDLRLPVVDPDSPVDAVRAALNMTGEELGRLHASLEDRLHQLEALLAQKETLMREVHHRVKNNLQVVVSLLRLQAALVPAGPARDVLAEAQARVHVMALVHELLHRSTEAALVDLSEYLPRLAGHIGRSLLAGRPGLAVRCAAPPRLVPVDVAIPLGLIVNELVSNACKHAFVGRAAGAVTVTLVCSDAGTATLVVCDDGVGLPDGHAPGRDRSLGLRLVRTLAGQLGATIDVDGGRGTTVTLRLALGRGGTP